MRHTIQSRWHTPRKPYSGDWRHNPWIKDTDNSSPARIEVADQPAPDRQQKAAIIIWEDEGGSIGTDGHVRR